MISNDSNNHQFQHYFDSRQRQSLLLEFVLKHGIINFHKQATCLEEWHAIVESSGYDPLESFPMHSLRHERLKGGGGGGG